MSDHLSSPRSSSTASELAARSVTPAAPGLRLDARQRAMLDEMGVKVWWPSQRRATAVDAVDATVDAASSEAGASAAPAAPASAPALGAPASAVRPEPAAVPRAPDAASASRPSTASPARTPAAGPAPAGRAPSRGVPGVAFEAPLRLYAVLDEDGIASAPTGGWLVVADMPPETDGHHGDPFAGEAGRLLDNMLRALQLHDGRAPVHLMRTHRASASSGGGVAVPPMGTDFAGPAAGLAPRIVLALGPLAAQSLLQSAEPLGRLRGRASPLRLAPDGPLDGVPVVVSYPPAYLLRNPADKARAWADLCLAADRFAGPPA